MLIINEKEYEFLDFSAYPDKYSEKEFQTSIERILFDKEGNYSDRYMDVTPLSFEEFREIPGFPGYYISTYGRVKSVHWSTLDWENERILKPLNITRGGYSKVTLCNSEKGKYKREIHYFMKLVFFPDTKLPQINHIDEVKFNNCIWNLHPCTSKYNMNHGTKISRGREKYLYGGGIEKQKESMKNGGMERWKKAMKEGGREKMRQALLNGGSEKGRQSRYLSGKTVPVTCVNIETGESKSFRTSAECGRYIHSFHPEANLGTIQAAISARKKGGHFREETYLGFKLFFN